jgi:hypothetical protein
VCTWLLSHCVIGFTDLDPCRHLFEHGREHDLLLGGDTIVFVALASVRRPPVADLAMAAADRRAMGRYDRSVTGWVARYDRRCLRAARCPA